MNKILMVGFLIIATVVIAFKYILPAFARNQCAHNLQDKSGYQLEREKEVYKYRFFTCLSYYGVEK
jgi:hypothetical protein